MTGCVFCEIIARRAPARFVRTWSDVVAFEPLSPVTDGHVLVVPDRHVVDFVEDRWVTGRVMECAADLARRPMNLITSAGAEATQTVFHLHVHLVPRRVGDGLALPWTSQTRSAA